MVPIDSPRAVSYLASVDHIEVSVTVCEIFDIQAIFPLDASLKVSETGRKLTRMRVYYFRCC